MSPIAWSSDGRTKQTASTQAERAAEDLTERMTLFTPEQPRRRLADLVLSAETERALQVALAKIQHHALLYQTWGLAEIHPEGRGVAVNLYGPSGTGKSFAAEAIAQHLSKPIIRVDYAQLESRYVGDTPKNIAAAFASARQHDAVLFFDEADSVLSHRVTNITQAADYGVNISRSTLLLQLDSFEGVVLFATNLARNYDPAIVRRILAHVPFTLPDQAALVRLWRYHLPQKLPRSADATPEALAALSEGLSGGDVLNCVLLAASQAALCGANAVTLADFAAAIEQVRRAKAEIGRSSLG
ncbi:MAG: ATP-binding protein [Anaerolineae bacterium]|nr:ATP-binding protein [Anaerolineae bacterium]